MKLLNLLLIILWSSLLGSDLSKLINKYTNDIVVSMILDIAVIFYHSYNLINSNK